MLSGMKPGSLLWGLEKCLACRESQGTLAARGEAMTTVMF